MEYEDPDLQEPSALAAARRPRKYLRRSTNVAVHGPRLLRVQLAAGGHEARSWEPGAAAGTLDWLCKTKARYLGPAFVQAQPQVPIRITCAAYAIPMVMRLDDSPRRYYLLISKAKISSSRLLRIGWQGNPARLLGLKTQSNQAQTCDSIQGRSATLGAAERGHGSPSHAARTEQHEASASKWAPTVVGKLSPPSVNEPKSRCWQMAQENKALALDTM
ncbi:hypothetical protein THAR02_08177 [Trichoderma harzianum]|uniref:Uncharacterized protein n=1 Tax=Trichoderma harzianum TaxID=5544 RepID=A0A0F9X3E8_TRIHA|nr:hypothetical protein THAR02_08177 [Trichoderma harzianum]